MAQTPRNLLEGRIRKLQQLHELLGDPEIEAEVAQLFSRRNGAVPSAAQPAPPPASAPALRGRGHGRRKPNMVRAAKEIVAHAIGPVSARMVADQLAAQGFRFPSPTKKYVAVSKALRWLWKHNEISATKSGPAPKAPMLYSRAEGQLQDAPLLLVADQQTASPSAKKLMDFFGQHGPAKRSEIVEHSGIPEGTVANLLTKKHLFHQRVDGRWEVNT